MISKIPGECISAKCTVGYTYLRSDVHSLVEEDLKLRERRFIDFDDNWRSFNCGWISDYTCAMTNCVNTWRCQCPRWLGYCRTFHAIIWSDQFPFKAICPCREVLGLDRYWHAREPRC